MAKRFPIAPAHPERTCWGCDLYCPSHDMRCGNGSERTQHPVELFGPDWQTVLPPADFPGDDEAAGPVPAQSPAPTSAAGG